MKYSGNVSEYNSPITIKGNILKERLSGPNFGDTIKSKKFSSNT